MCISVVSVQNVYRTLTFLDFYYLLGLLLKAILEQMDNFT